MNIGVLGTGMVGRALVGKLAQLGHAVILGTRNVEDTVARNEKDGLSGLPLAEWRAQNPTVELGTFAQAAAHGEVIINATNGSVSLEALKQAGEANLNGKVLIDVSNPLDFSKGMPPTLFVKDTDSLAEQIQRGFPNARVVKTLNTLTAALMINPGQLADGEHTVFVSGNDAAAKAVAVELLQSFGWRDILDLGDLSTARGAEMFMPLWLRAWGALGTGIFNFKVVR